jgi:hypothetical protein
LIAIAIEDVVANSESQPPLERGVCIDGIWELNLPSSADVSECVGGLLQIYPQFNDVSLVRVKEAMQVIVEECVRVQEKGSTLECCALATCVRALVVAASVVAVNRLDHW